VLREYTRSKRAGIVDPIYRAQRLFPKLPTYFVQGAGIGVGASDGTSWMKSYVLSPPMSRRVLEMQLWNLLEPRTGRAELDSGEQSAQDRKLLPA